MTDNRMRLNLHNNKTGLTMTLRHDEGLSAQDVLDAYRLVSRESHDDEALTHKSVVMKNDITRDELSNLIEKHNTEADRFKNSEGKSRPKATKLVGSEHTLSTPIGELANFSQYDERVKVKVDCPECMYDGENTVPEHFKFTKCPECGLKLFNSWAGDGPGQVDFRGYAFYADSEMIFKHQEEE